MERHGRPETFALLSQDLRPGVLLDPEDVTRRIATEAIEGSEVRPIDLGWDIVMAAPGLGGDPSAVPPIYYLDLITGAVQRWTEDTVAELTALYGAP